ncbi:MAG: hypothetical protein ACXW2I_18065 [Burkholderiales bacterium]
MTLTECPVTPTFVAEVGDVDLSKPRPDADLEAIKDAFWRARVALAPSQLLLQAEPKPEE